jgi:lysylphosphatidylglycerol synthetase-like protein (DUF2156 family)
MLTNAALAAVALLLVGGGLASNADRTWPIIDAVAQTLSLIIAYRLLSTGWEGDEAGAALLVVLAVAVVVGHVTGLNTKSQIWAYIDGANLGAWGTLVLWGIIGAIKGKKEGRALPIS